MATRATRFVRAQLDQLRINLFENLHRAQLNHDYWHEMDCLDADSKFEIRNAVTEAFELASRRWYHMREVLHELEAISEIIKDALEIALDVIYPDFVNAHIQRVIENVMVRFDRWWGPRLECAMFDYVHAAVKIQDAWLECYYRPDHPVCKRRLLRSFEEFEKDLERLRAR
jgi:hypothetical protein